jgi:hypothetical protein
MSRRGNRDQLRIAQWTCQPRRHKRREKFRVLACLATTAKKDGKLDGENRGVREAGVKRRERYQVLASAVNEEGEEIYPRKWNYEFADVPLIGDQRTPMYTGENVTRIVDKAKGQERIIFALFASSRPRAGELFALEVKHFKGNTLTIEQSLWEGKLQRPKNEECIPAGRSCHVNGRCSSHVHWRPK